MMEQTQFITSKLVEVTRAYAAKTGVQMPFRFYIEVEHDSNFGFALMTTYPPDYPDVFALLNNTLTIEECAEEADIDPQMLHDNIELARECLPFHQSADAWISLLLYQWGAAETETPLNNHRSGRWFFTESRYFALVVHEDGTITTEPTKVWIGRVT